MTLRRKLLIASIAIISIVVFGFLSFAAARIDDKFNRVRPAPIPVSEHARKLHESLQIVDLHCDCLLWDRDLLTRNQQGHVDIPRLLEGNVAIQTFSIVSKVPKNLNIERNSNDTDDVTLLAMVERWPPDTSRHIFSTMISVALLTA